MKKSADWYRELQQVEDVDINASNSSRRVISKDIFYYNATGTTKLIKYHQTTTEKKSQDTTM